MKKLITILSILLIPAAAAWAGGTAKISTYYPAPFGAYDRLRLVPRAMPDCTDALSGLVFYDSADNTLKVCENAASGFKRMAGGVWTQNNIDASNADVYLTEMDEAAPRAVKVGIGTKTPQADLHIMGDGNVVLEDGSTTLTFLNNTVGEADYQFEAFNFENLFLQGDLDDDGIFEKTLMKFGSDGFVGIGLTWAQEPLYELHIGDDAEIILENDSSQSFTFLDTDAGGAAFAFENSHPDYLALRSDTDGDKVIDATIAAWGKDGRFGIGLGTDVPLEDLHVKGTGKIITESESAGTTFITKTAGHPDFQWKAGPWDHLVFQADWPIGVQPQGDDVWDTNLLNLRRDGNVGMAMWDPDERLQIGGSIELQGSDPDIEMYDTTAPGTAFRMSLGSGPAPFPDGFSLQQDNNDDGNFTAHTDRFVIDRATGFIGIGTTNPQADLHIAGGGELAMQGHSAGVTYRTTTAGQADFHTSAYWLDRYYWLIDNDEDGLWDFPRAMGLHSSGQLVIGDENLPGSPETLNVINNANGIIRMKLGANPWGELQLQIGSDGNFYCEPPPP